jgi:hypothetical protein
MRRSLRGDAASGHFGEHPFECPIRQLRQHVPRDGGPPYPPRCIWCKKAANTRGPRIAIFSEMVRMTARSSSFPPARAGRACAPQFLPILALILACCGGNAVVTREYDAGVTPAGDGGVPPAEGEGGVPAGDASAPPLCPVHVSGTAPGRPSDMACAVTTNVPPTPDGGAVECRFDSDCMVYAHGFCRNNTCQPDQCFKDSDCIPGQACSCANEQIGNAIHTNRCVAAGCLIDSDCAAGETCSRTDADLCSGEGPFFACRSAADTCRVDADCCPAAPSCRYRSLVGHWACVAACMIAG